MNAIVTGATKGIGKAIALKLAEKGYNLAICARNYHELLAFSQELELMGIKVVFLPTDCAYKQAVKDFCDFASAELGEIDVLVNNAGAYLPGALLDEPEDHFEQQVAVNLSAAYYISRYFGKKMRERRSGHLFNICSIASKEYVENAGSYVVTKTALLSLTHVLRQELAPHDVKVTAILPGSTLTASWEGTSIAKDRFVQPEDVAETIDTILNLSAGANVDEIILKPKNF